MDVKKMIALGMLGGKPPITYLLRDQFTTDDAAPLTSPRTCEPGPSTITVTDTGNKLSISGAQLVKATGATYKFVGSAQTRKGGLAFYCRDKITTTNNHAKIVLSTNGAAFTDGLRYHVGASNYVYDSATAVATYGINPIADAFEETLVIERPTAGCIVLGRAGIYGKWTIIYIGYKSTATTLYPAYIVDESTAANGITKEFSTLILGGNCATDFGLASYYSATPTSPENVTGTINGFEEITWTPDTDEVLELEFGKADADNRHIIRCSQAGSTIKTIKVTAGTESELSTAAQTFTVGTAYRIAVRVFYSNIQAWVNSVSKANLTEAIVNNAGYGASGFTTATNYAVYPLEVALPRPFDLPSYGWFLGIGDSKTSRLQWQGTLIDLLEAGAGGRWGFETIAYPGITMGGEAARIGVDLTQTRQTPSYVLFNFGANNVTSLPAEATWKADAQTVLDAVHAKWPSAQVYLMRIWRRSYAANCNTLAGWIGDLVTTNSTFCHLGPDERVFLENGDNGATYTSDGIYPNAAGYALTAAQWEAVIHP